MGEARVLNGTLARRRKSFQKVVYITLDLLLAYPPRISFLSISNTLFHRQNVVLKSVEDWDRDRRANSASRHVHEWSHMPGSPKNSSEIQTDRSPVVITITDNAYTYSEAPYSISGRQ